MLKKHVCLWHLVTQLRGEHGGAGLLWDLVVLESFSNFNASMQYGELSCGLPFLYCHLRAALLLQQTNLSTVLPKAE